MHTSCNTFACGHVGHGGDFLHWSCSSFSGWSSWLGDFVVVFEHQLHAVVMGNQGPLVSQRAHIGVDPRFRVVLQRPTSGPLEFAVW